MTAGGAGGGTPDITPPSLISSSPATGATGVLQTATLSLTFSEPMNRMSLAVSTVPASNLGTASWDASGRMVTFNPTSGWQSDTSYTVTVDGTSKEYWTTATDVDWDTTALPEGMSALGSGDVR